MFPAKHIKNVSSVTSRLVECVIDADSFSDLEMALSVPNCSLSVSDSLDASAPLLSTESAAQALDKFRKRTTRTVQRLRASGNPFHRRLATFIENHRDHGTRLSIPPARPETLYMSACIKVPDIEMILTPELHASAGLSLMALPSM